MSERDKPGERLFLVFMSGGIEFCAAIGHVEEIVAAKPRLVKDGRFPMELSHRESPLGVVDFAGLLGLVEHGDEPGIEPDGGRPDRTNPDRMNDEEAGGERNIVLVSNPEGFKIGLVVGPIVGIEDFGEKTLAPFPALLSGEGTALFGGWYRRAGAGFPLLVDLQKVAAEACS